MKLFTLNLCLKFHSDTGSKEINKWCDIMKGVTAKYQHCPHKYLASPFRFMKYNFLFFLLQTLATTVHNNSDM